MDEDKGFRILDEVQRIAQARGVSVAQVALNYLLRKPAVSAVLVGATKPEQLQDNLKATSWTLEEAEVKALDAVSQPGRPYPHWMLDFTRGDRTSPQML